MTITLRDAQQLRREHPDTFDAPDLDDLERLQVGDLVKLAFVFPDRSERMWVEITERVGHGWLGELRNCPVSNELKFGDEIRFEPRHVYDFEQASTGKKRSPKRGVRAAVTAAGRTFARHLLTRLRLTR